MLFNFGRGIIFGAIYTLILSALLETTPGMAAGLFVVMYLVVATVAEHHPIEQFRRMGFAVAAHVVAHILFGFLVGLIVGASGFRYSAPSLRDGKLRENSHSAGAGPWQPVRSKEIIMSQPVRILGIAGSLRAGSYNRAALRACDGLLPRGATLDTFDLAGIPGFSEDDEKDPPEKVVELKRRVRGADAILFVTPEYNYSIPGVLKNAIDWASRPYGDSAWSGKPAAIMGASIGGIGTARAQYHLRQVMVFLDMFPVNQPEVMIGHAQERFDKDGNLTDESTRDHIRKLLVSLADWTRRLQGSEQR